MQKSKKGSSNEQRIFLTGFMGTGKTSVGARLAKEMKIPFIDLDEVVEIREFRTITEIFEVEGEKYFREQEVLALIAVIASLDKFVMATGGGIVLRKENRELMRDSGTIVCLTADKAEILRRLKNDTTRPLLGGGMNGREVPVGGSSHLQALLKKRDKYYRDCHFRIDTKGKEIAKIVDEIKFFFNHK